MNIKRPATILISISGGFGLVFLVFAVALAAGEEFHFSANTDWEIYSVWSGSPNDNCSNSVNGDYLSTEGGGATGYSFGCTVDWKTIPSDTVGIAFDFIYESTTGQLDAGASGAMLHTSGVGPDGDVGDTLCAIDYTTGLDTWANANCDVWTYSYEGDSELIQYMGGWYNSNYHFEWVKLDNFRWIIEGAEPPPPVVLSYDADCTFTTTIEISTTLPTSPTQTYTQTTVVTYTRPANLVENYGFETPNPAGPGPAAWSPVVDQVIAVVPDYYAEGQPAAAHGGSDSVYNADVFDLYNKVVYWGSGDYLIGMYASNNDVQLYMNGSLKATSTATGTYQLFTNTFSTGGGAGWLNLAFRSADGLAHVDDVFIYPIDDDGNLLCDQDLFAPYDPGDDVGNTGGIPGAIGGAGSICYRCDPPDGISYLDISYWIAWLGCVLRNMFSCSLRVWLLVIGNWINGQIQMGLAWLQWIPLTTQQFATWLASEVIPNMISTTIIYDTGTNLWDLLIAVIGLIADLIQFISDLFLAIIDLLMLIVNSIRGVFAVEPASIDFGGIGAEPDPGQLAAGGFNEDKALYLFLVSVGMMDQIMVGNLATIFAIIMGGLALIMAWWTLNYWRDLVTF